MSKNPPRLKFSTLGRAALYEHMVDALSPDSDHGLDTVAVIENPDISNADLALMAARVAKISKLENGLVGATDRQGLVAHLAELLDSAVENPYSLVKDEHHTFRKRSAPSGEVNPDTLRVQTPKQNSMAQGKSDNASDRVLRALRHEAGWVALSTMRSILGNPKKIVETLVQEYKAARIAEGMTEAQAEAKMQRSYIAIIPKDKPRHIHGYTAQIERERLEKGHHMVTWIDLSPDAVKDFEQVAQEVAKEKMDQSPVYSLFEKYEIPYDHTAARQIAKEVWEKKVQERHAEEGGTQFQARDWVKENYLDGTTHVMHLRLGKNVTHEALWNMDVALLGLMEKGEVQKPTSLRR